MVPSALPLGYVNLVTWWKGCLPGLLHLSRLFTQRDFFSLNKVLNRFYTSFFFYFLKESFIWFFFNHKWVLWMSNGFFSSTEIQGHSVLLALCQLRRQRPWMSQTAGGEADHSGSGPSAWLLSVTSSCCMLFGAQFVWRQKNNTHGKALLLRGRKEKELNLY